MFENARELSGLEGLIKPGRHGRSDGPAGVRIQLCPPRAMASVIARKHRLADTVTAARESFGIDLPMTPKRGAHDGVAFAWAGPGQWLAMSESESPARFESRLLTALGTSASVFDQSGGRVVIRISGSAARDVLAKAVPLDLHPSVFPAGTTASTLAGHIGVQIWLLADTPSFELAVSRSYAQSFWLFLLASAAEFGVDVT
jgi:sarcosine oxidase subunit gamma